GPRPAEPRQGPGDPAPARSMGRTVGGSQVPLLAQEPAHRSLDGPALGVFPAAVDDGVTVKPQGGTDPGVRPRPGEHPGGHFFQDEETGRLTPGGAEDVQAVPLGNTADGVDAVADPVGGVAGVDGLVLDLSALQQAGLRPGPQEKVTVDLVRPPQ